MLARYDDEELRTEKRLRPSPTLFFGGCALLPVRWPSFVVRPSSSGDRAGRSFRIAGISQASAATSNIIPTHISMMLAGSMRFSTVIVAPATIAAIRAAAETIGKIRL